MHLVMIQRFGIGILLAGIAALLQGCLAAVWVAAVGVGTTMNGSVEFDAFENTWVAPADSWVARDRMESVAVPPFAGDEAMATRFSVALRHTSTLRVIGPEQLAERPTRIPAADHRRIGQAIASQAQVDCVLLGTVLTGNVQTDRWGNKEVTSNRLKLTLVDAEGRPLWRDELPYRVIEGAQALPEEWIQESLTHHLAAHAQAIGLARIGDPDERIQARLHSRLPPTERF